MASSIYETHRMVSDYLLFHYGREEQILPDEGGPRDALDFPARCAALTSRFATHHHRALDLGCAVGRAAMELTRSFAAVVGLDYSKKFIDAAKAMQIAGRLQVTRHEEGTCFTPVDVDLPEKVNPSRCTYQVGDACALPESLGTFDAVLAANLICRLHDPSCFLNSIASFVAANGVLVLSTPCTWMEEFTPKEKWLARDGQTTLEGLQSALAGDFTLEHTEELPFLIREHARKFQWSLAQTSVWRRLG